MRYFKQTQPFVVPMPDNKLIEEHFGMASTGHSQYSVAHMVAPSRWSEPWQTPAFDEITIMIRGALQIETSEGVFTIQKGETFLASGGNKVRYTNPFDYEAEYWAVCVPAFSPQTVNRA